MMTKFKNGERSAGVLGLLSMVMSKKVRGKSVLDMSRSYDTTDDYEQRVTQPQLPVMAALDTISFQDLSGRREKEKKKTLFP